MFPGVPRPLSYPLDSSVVLENEVPDGATPGQPTWAADSDERIFVVMEVSLNEYVQLASAIDAGRDPAYPDYSQYIWWLWCKVIHSMTFCEEMAQCFTDQNEALMLAVAAAITNNPLLIAAIASAISEAGGAVPGRPLTENQSNQDTLPPEVRNEFDECIEDMLWGACLFLVQSGNRAITDFFELTEAASNTLETSSIVANAIPAAGGYASAALEFADQIAETLQEGYAGAYTEGYETGLSCDIFCVADVDCELTPDMLVETVNERLPSPENALNFGMVMARVGTGVFTGAEIADAAFYIYFTALKFGQQFGEVAGFRPLTDTMSLGADQLASDNWRILCNCPGVWEWEGGLAELESWTPDLDYNDYGQFYEDCGWGAGPIQPRSNLFGILFDAPTELLYIEYEFTEPMTGNLRRVYCMNRPLYLPVQEFEPLDGVIAGFTINGTWDGMIIGGYNDTNPAVTMPGCINRVFVRGRGYQPPQLGG